MVVIVVCYEIQGFIFGWMQCGVNCFVFGQGDWGWWYVWYYIGIVRGWFVQVGVGDFVVVVFVYVIDYCWIGL